MTDTKKLEKAIKDSGYKKSYIAKQIGLSRGGLCNCINNRAEFRASQINALCNLLKLDIAQRNAIFFGLSGGCDTPKPQADQMAKTGHA